jgi:UDP-N-acetylglucosamine 1-carboxyvinyltransferase
MEVDARDLGPARPQAGRRRDRAVPALATDIQPPTTVLLTQANGDSTVTSDLRGSARVDGGARKMGAKIELKGPQRAVVHGPSKLQAATVEISDLRAGASLILAALAANGTSSIGGAHHVGEGMRTSNGKFLDLGARIERVQEGGTTPA